jgi:hypothetical protein
MFAQKKGCRIEFLGDTADCAELFDPPIPAKDLLPEWYKRMPSYCTPERSITKHGHFNSTIKHCMPALDAMTTGYILTLPQDLHVTEHTEANISTSWPMDNMQLIENHSIEQISEYQIDTERWSASALKLINRWVIKTPPGYSTLFMSPMWQDDNRFFVFPGVVDTDLYPQPINFPFLLQRGFVGTIGYGTPFVQLIPFKRDEWDSEVGVKSEEMRKSWLKVTRQAAHRYKQNFRSPKRYS